MTKTNVMKTFRSITTQILLAVIITVVTVLGVSGVIELKILKGREEQLLQQRGMLTADRIANSLAYPLWNLNRTDTERVVLDEFAAQEVSRIQVFDEQGQPYVEKYKAADGSVQDGTAATPIKEAVADFSFSRDVRFRNNRIGSVTLQVSAANLHAEFSQLRWGIAVRLLLLVILLPVVLYTVLNLLIVRPLSSLKSWVEIGPVHTPPPHSKYSSEINSLADAFDRLSTNLRQKHNELENKHRHLLELNAQLQERIEERRLMEQALKANEELLKLFVKHTPAAIAMFDKDMQYLQVSDRFLTDYHLEGQNIIGKNHYEVFPDLPERWKNVHQRILAGAVERCEEDPYVEPNGNQGWMQWESLPWRKAGGEVGGLILFTQVITQRKHSELALRVSEERLRALSAKMEFAREEEGARIAREIHDELGGTLTGLKWDLEGLDTRLLNSNGHANVAEIRKHIHSMIGLIESTINAVRRISSELRPGLLDDLGLVAAIEWHAQQIEKRTGITIHWESELESAHITREGATAVFRIFQEVLTNVLRHSGARNIHVRLLERETELELQVVDDGRGITEDEQHNTRSLGLLGMKERALLVGGEVSITGAKGKGTTVVVRIPLSKDSESAIA